mgnify:FL=1
MTYVFDNYLSDENSFLEELADELEETFHVIAHAGYESDVKFIRKRQKYFKNKYGRFIEHCVSDIADELIIPAYHNLMSLYPDDENPDWKKYNSENAISDCEEALYQYLLVGMTEEVRDPDEDYPFEEFFKKHHPV